MNGSQHGISKTNFRSSLNETATHYPEVSDLGGLGRVKSHNRLPAVLI